MLDPETKGGAAAAPSLARGLYEPPQVPAPGREEDEIGRTAAQTLSAAFHPAPPAPCRVPAQSPAADSRMLQLALKGRGLTLSGDRRWLRGRRDGRSGASDARAEWWAPFGGMAGGSGGRKSLLPGA
ncbi:hypothetical protein GCM10012287_25930 [Streptomyces daqingensis]|uniref:Uncharacterized protein n=1 Tax=Streptomyces daqingensis TaxID=1472640 RepID=A0ABQ2MAZ2_9ACTN|nr:hypothetical protein GCM10012287_25930 [Streptomyces daqingensis]